MAAGAEVDPRPVSGVDELSWHQQNLLTQGLERGVVKLRWQTEALEPVDQIVGKQEQRK